MDLHRLYINTPRVATLTTQLEHYIYTVHVQNRLPPSMPSTNIEEVNYCLKHIKKSSLCIYELIKLNLCTRLLSLPVSLHALVPSKMPQINDAMAEPHCRFLYIAVLMVWPIHTHPTPTPTPTQIFPMYSSGFVFKTKL